MASTDTHQYSSLFLSDISEVKKVFDRFDTNGDGKISRDELSHVLLALGSEPSQDEVDRMMDELDCNKDGFVNLEEFAEFCGRKNGGGGDDDDADSRELREAFDMYDQDKNGLISATELHLVLSRLGERCSVQDCSQMINSVDNDGDGSVDFDEFCKMMTKSSS